MMARRERIPKVSRDRDTRRTWSSARSVYRGRMSGILGDRFYICKTDDRHQTRPQAQECRGAMVLQSRLVDSARNLESVPSAVNRANPADAGTMTALAMRSKAHWGYDADFMRNVAPLLDFRRVEIAHALIYVLEDAVTILGLYRLTMIDDRPFLTIFGSIRSTSALVSAGVSGCMHSIRPVRLGGIIC